MNRDSDGEVPFIFMESILRYPDDKFNILSESVLKELIEPEDRVTVVTFADEYCMIQHGLLRRARLGLRSLNVTHSVRVEPYVSPLVTRFQLKICVGKLMTAAVRRSYSQLASKITYIRNDG